MPLGFSECDYLLFPSYSSFSLTPHQLLCSLPYHQLLCSLTLSSTPLLWQITIALLFELPIIMHRTAGGVSGKEGEARKADEDDDDDEDCSLCLDTYAEVRVATIDYTNATTDNTRAILREYYSEIL